MVKADPKSEAAAPEEETSSFDFMKKKGPTAAPAPAASEESGPSAFGFMSKTGQCCRDFDFSAVPGWRGLRSHSGADPPSPLHPAGSTSPAARTPGSQRIAAPRVATPGSGESHVTAAPRHRCRYSPDVLYPLLQPEQDPRRSDGGAILPALHVKRLRRQPRSC